MSTFLLYACIFIGFFFLVILPLHKKYGTKYGVRENDWEFPQDKSDEDIDIVNDPKYSFIPGNIYHRN